MKTNMKNEKMYPFSVVNFGEYIDFYTQHLLNIMCDMEWGRIPMDKNRYDRISTMYYGELNSLLSVIHSAGATAYLTRKQLELVKKIIVWARTVKAYNPTMRHIEYIA